MKKNKFDKIDGSKFGKRAVFAFLVVFSALAFTRVVLFNILATSGQRLAAANQKISILQEENQKFENKVSSMQSLSKVDKFAQDAGFKKADNIQVLTPSGPVANR